MIPFHPNLLLFATFAGILSLAALGVVLFPNAVRSALCLVLSFFVLAFLYFSLGFEMLGITQIVVYTGAIMVLFLFVVMLLNLGKPSAVNERFDIKKPLGIGLGAVFAGVISAAVLPLFLKTNAPEPIKGFGGPEAVGRSLFTDYVFPFEVVSVLLLISVVGSILLAKRRIG